MERVLTIKEISLPLGSQFFYALDTMSRSKPAKFHAWSLLRLVETLTQTQAFAAPLALIRLCSKYWQLSLHNI